MNSFRHFSKYKANDLLSIFGGLSWLFSLFCLIFMSVSIEVSRPFCLLLSFLMSCIWTISVLCLYYGMRCGIYIKNGEIYELRWKKHIISPNEIKCVVIIPKTRPFRSVYIGGGPHVETIKDHGESNILYDIILLNNTEFQITADYKKGGDEIFILNNRKRIIAYSIYNPDLLNCLRELNSSINIIYL